LASANGYQLKVKGALAHTCHLVFSKKCSQTSHFQKSLAGLNACLLMHLQVLKQMQAEV
jgi:hypothetical protein